jgi:hypothetical protein
VIVTEAARRANRAPPLRHGLADAVGGKPGLGSVPSPRVPHSGSHETMDSGDEPSRYPEKNPTQPLKKNGPRGSGRVG